MKYRNLTFVVALLLGAFSTFAQNNQPREKLLMDFGWRFAFGNATDPAKDFDPAPANEMFNYLTKAGNARGAASADAQGRLVPDAANKIHFELAGPGKILGVGNGDPSSHEPDVYLPTGDSAPDWQRSLFSGLAQIIVQSTKEPGEIKLTAHADGLTPVTLTIPSQLTTPRPAVAAR